MAYNNNMIYWVHVCCMVSVYLEVI